MFSGYHTNGIQPVVNQVFNTQYIYIYVCVIMSGGCSKCEASAGHGAIQYQTGCSKCDRQETTIYIFTTFGASRSVLKSMAKLERSK